MAKSSKKSKKKNTGCEVPVGIVILRLSVICGIVLALAIYTQSIA